MAPGKAESGGGNQALVVTCQKHAFREGLLPLIGCGAGGSTREEDNTSAQDWSGGVGVGAFWLEGTNDKENVYMTVGRQGRGVWGGGGASGNLGRSNAEITTGLEYKCN